jgi:enediyne biosynthesis protein E4
VAPQNLEFLGYRVVTGQHSRVDEVHSGGSLMSQNDLRLHFGLGDADLIDVLEAKWPTSQKTERFTDVPANQILIIKEESGIINRQEAKS